MRVLFARMLAEPGHYESEVASLRDCKEGCDDSMWFKNRLSEMGVADTVDVVTVAVAKGEALPEVPGDGTAFPFDAVVVGGTFHSAHDGRPFQLELMGWLQRLRKLNVPLLGICGGHQLLAIMHGGTVERRPEPPTVRQRDLRCPANPLLPARTVALKALKPHLCS
jgi:GMP synthase-like glutamine amidotransferase